MSEATIFVMERLQFSSRRRVPLILQAEIAECGIASIAMVASYYGHHLNMHSIRNRCSANLKGTTLQQLIELGDGLGLASRALKCPLEQISRLGLPCIVHWDLNHFVVLTKIRRNNIQINDPAKGRCKLSLQEFAEHFSGIVLELTPTTGFEKTKKPRRMQLSQLWSKITGIKSALVKLLILSFIIQACILAAPYYLQIVVDDVLLSLDRSLLMVLAFGFGLLSLLNVVTWSTRSWLVLRLSSSLNMQMGVNLLQHLLHLPMRYFEARHIGDIVSRFGSIAQVRERISTGLVETIVDGLMSIAVLVMMLLYSIKLTMVVASVVLAYSLLRMSLYRPLHEATEESIQNQAKEQSNFLENIRAIQTIKLFGSEAQRRTIWQNRYVEVVNSEIRLGKLNIGFDAMNRVLFGLENILVIFLAATLVIDKQLTIGMVLAFLAYKNQFTDRTINFVEQIVEFRMMRLHLERIADIALTAQETNQYGRLASTECKGVLTLENISFAYQDDGQYVLRNLNASIKPGECVAITGISGSGKTTLAKIVLGLIQPDSGRVFIDGCDINQMGLKAYRKRTAAVMQGDLLLAGSIADNICFFDPEPDFLKIEKCAQLSAVHADIIRMPMGYNALVGDMGANLSGGQVQRLLLARALYKQPTLLLLDEATSHLDLDNEVKIAKQIEDLSMTRIIIAHRPETIAMANRVLRLHQGRLISAQSSEEA